jgi:hypothetical protein
VQNIDGPVRATVDGTVAPLTETSSRLTRLPRFPCRLHATTCKNWASVVEFGVRIPLLVAPDGPAYRVIEGHRRLAAAVKAGLDAAPCTVPFQRLQLVHGSRHYDPDGEPPAVFSQNAGLPV